MSVETNITNRPIRKKIDVAKGVERWGLRGSEAPPYIFFSPSIETLSPPFQEFITTVHPIALQQ